jgi:gas vesicle protein
MRKLTTMVMLAALLPLLAQASDTADPTLVADQAKAVAETVKSGAKQIAEAAKEQATQIATTAKQVAHEVASASKEGAEQVADTAKRGVEKAKAAVNADKPASPPAPPTP